VTEGNVIYFCPECGSPSIERSLISNTTSSCRACSWAGASDRVVAMPVSGDSASLIVSLVGDLRTLMGQEMGLVLLRFFVKWGFISEATEKTVMSRQLARYLAAAARGIITALFEERQKMEVERNVGS
jgi:hypothetical protein